jgi:hypothetical protein
LQSSGNMEAMQRSTHWRGRSALLSLATVLILATVIPSQASAAFHLNKIREVFVGAGNSYVELQAYASGENFLDGHEVTLYDSTGNALGDGAPLHMVPNGGNQRTALVGASASVNGVPADIVDADVGLLDRAGGAVCFDAIPVDCVAWGNFGGGGALPGTVGPPAASPGGLPADTALVRSIARGCATLLEASDDTDDSAADFALEPPNPIPNSAVPTEQPCGGGGGGAPDTEIDKGPKKKIKGKTAKFKFSSPTAGASFECSLDDKPFKACTSPLKLKRIKLGKHVFQVRAVSGGTPDPSPAKFKFKRVEKKK